MDEKRLRRWRLVLGNDENDQTRSSALQTSADQKIDDLLDTLYGDEGQGVGAEGGFADSSPTLSRWLGDVRRYFPQSMVEVLQKDALDRFGWMPFISDPDIMRTLQPDIHIAATILQLAPLIPADTRDSARVIVRQLVEDLRRRLDAPTRQAIQGKLNRAQRNYNPRQHEIDWHRTIRRNLKHYQPQYRTIIPEKRIGFSYKRPQLYDVILCVDQSGSMATSMIYSSVLAAVLASIPALKVRLVFFDTSVVDMTDTLDDPVELLFGLNLGGGTDIGGALAYCEKLIEKPTDTVMVLISDLYESGSPNPMLTLMQRIKSSGVNFISLLALNDLGSPAYNRHLAASMATMQVPAFACTPDLFPEMMAAALNHQDIGEWASRQGIHTTLSAH